jgi:uncharacterized protein (DUF39 family)
MKNLTYCSAGQLSPLLNDPRYRTIGIGTSVWLAGARGHVYAQGTQHASDCERGENGVPTEGAGTLALTGNMKEMDSEYVRGVSLKGYGVSLALGVGIPIPILDRDVLRACTVRDSEIFASVIDYSTTYPERGSDVICKLSYADLKSGEVEIDGKKVQTGSLSSYSKALKIAEILKEEIRKGGFLLSKPHQDLPANQGMKPLNIKPSGSAS